MQNRQSSSQQIFRFLILSVAAYFLMQSFFGKPKTTAPVGPAQIAPPMEMAFAGIAPVEKSKLPTPTAAPTAAAASTQAAPVAPAVSMAPITKANAPAEIKKLDAAIAGSPNDEYAQWALLRKGLIEQYVLGAMSARPRPHGPFDFIIGLFSKLPETQNAYDQVIAHGGTDEVAAQATYQQGDLLWNEGVAKDGQPSALAASTLEQLIHKGRGNSQLLTLEVYVPRVQAQEKATLASTRVPPTTRGTFKVVGLPPFQVPVGGFVPIAVHDLRGTLAQPYSFGIPDRVNANYSGGVLYKIFDAVVKTFNKITNNNPNLSFGLAILFLALAARVLLQPLMRRQYENMKGMQVIAPEMKKIQEKYKGKPPEEQTKMMGEIRELQRRHGVNPMAGCGLALVQMPIIFFIVYPMILHYEPKMDLASASFLWIHNLAHPDIPLLAIYAVSMLISSRLSATPPTDPQQAQMQGMMVFAGPFFALFLLTYPSALTLYWTTYNIASMILQYRLMKAADPTKDFKKLLLSNPLAPMTVTAGADGSSAIAIPPRPQNRPASTRKPVTLAPTSTAGEVMTGSNGTVRENGATRDGDNGKSDSPFNENGVALHSDTKTDNAPPSPSGPKRSATRSRQKRRY